MQDIKSKIFHPASFDWSSRAHPFLIPLSFATAQQNRLDHLVLYKVKIWSISLIIYVPEEESVDST